MCNYQKKTRQQRIYQLRPCELYSCLICASLRLDPYRISVKLDRYISIVRFPLQLSYLLYFYLSAVNGYGPLKRNKQNRKTAINLIFVHNVSMLTSVTALTAFDSNNGNNDNLTNSNGITMFLEDTTKNVDDEKWPQQTHNLARG